MEAWDCLPQQLTRNKRSLWAVWPLLRRASRHTQFCLHGASVWSTLPCIEAQWPCNQPVCASHRGTDIEGLTALARPVPELEFHFLHTQRECNHVSPPLGINASSATVPVTCDQDYIHGLEFSFSLTRWVSPNTLALLETLAPARLQAHLSCFTAVQEAKRHCET